MKYYMVVDGERKGPFAKEELLALGLERNTLVWYSGLEDWTEAVRAPELSDLFGSEPPPVPQRRPADEDRYSPESRRGDDDDRYAPAAGRPDDEGRYAPPGRRADGDRFEGDSGGVSNPGTFRMLYVFFVLTTLLSFLPLVAGFVFLIIAENIQVSRSQYKYDPYYGGYRTTYDYDSAAASRRDMFRVLAILGWGSGGLFGLAAAVFLIVLLYKAWAVIPEGRARTSPGLAVGLLFIPFFNLYWIFVAYFGLAQDMNRFAERIGIRRYSVPEGLALTFCIFSVVPCLNFFSWLLLLILMNSVKNTAAAIAEKRLRAEAATA